ncbi:Cation efflux protein transmembrane domain [Lasallia pustulata]|uniref:Cation efflux protein transmembrane domain n=1 Tax=Lasallia pustulata TaxID=136370 RepID=A0A1W5CT78_9LECA|nr:Cation efflux protein transmembrane domain [Lasallia pustulata]
MGLSKSNRIIVLLAIDSAFFLLELIVGYAVHSLALVADSFHMLNDVLSLCVGYWAVKVANQKTSSIYTYGWQRAETLGALVNGVFLVALCLSIFLEAIQRFVEPQTVSNPKLVFIVGSCGFVSNILGLVLFHEHGNNHSGSESNNVSAAEEGHSHGPVSGTDEHTHHIADEGGNVADVLPQSTIAGWPKTTSASTTKKERTQGQRGLDSRGFSNSDEDDSMAAGSSPISVKKHSSANSHRRHRRRTSGSRSRFGNVDDIHIHPRRIREDIIAAGRLENIESRTGSESEGEEAIEDDEQHPTEESPLLGNANSNGSSDQKGHADNRHDSWHALHKHNQPKAEGDQGGHSHGDLNMRGVFLHVMGDALGNIGVIVSALFIWGTSYSWRFYADPAISLIITMIILASAIPLCMAASRILLQAVPAGISIDDIKADIAELPGILSCHHVHVWQLSDTKLVASLHVQVEYDFKGEGSARYMGLARQIRHCLHGYGIHESTIQPEFCLNVDHRHTDDGSDGSHSGDAVSKAKTGSKGASRAASMRSEPDACLLECDDACGDTNQCCVPNNPESDSREGGGHSR